jgi:site-specific DNA-methyltransferase (cytosine-N4-specific)
LHPAIMPLELAKRCIKLFSWVDDVVLDPFAGSGTTLLAAKELNRNFIGYELYKNYKKVIEKKVYGI